MKANRAINTKVPYRIDVHHHVLPRFYAETLERVAITNALGAVFSDWSLEAHLEVMNRNKIAIGMASIPAGIYFESDAFARDLARRCNEYLASLRNEYPTRFGAFAVLPVPDVDGALGEATYALDTLRLDGVVMLSNVVGHYVGDPENDALFAELNRRNTVVYIHPGDPPDKGIPAAILYPIDMALETVRATMSLLYGGVFERYPQVKFIFSHCGGITPYLAHRMARGRTWVRGEGGPDPGMLDEATNDGGSARAIELLQRQYYDSMSANAATGMQTLQAFVDPTHILFGTDHAAMPARYQPLKMRELMRYKGFDDATRMGVERENALRLFPRLLEVL
ncbi:MAG TPA: amidohydrolase family protein [Anaerolineae bacterium]|nr:amidohydrolase family protein [Anaerolineae bacterium]